MYLVSPVQTSLDKRAAVSETEMTVREKCVPSTIPGRESRGKTIYRPVGRHNVFGFSKNIEVTPDRIFRPCIFFQCRPQIGNGLKCGPALFPFARSQFQSTPCRVLFQGKSCEIIRHFRSRGFVRGSLFDQFDRGYCLPGQPYRSRVIGNSLMAQPEEDRVKAEDKELYSASFQAEEGLTPIICSAVRSTAYRLPPPRE